MHVEIQVAISFLISFLFNKLPRRRVNQFGEELEKALKVKFQDHWYPEKPFKGSAYRCVRCTPPLDSLVFEAAARASGMDLIDIQENLPQELSIWIDPGEVSYRMSEKGPVKILYSEQSENVENEHYDREVTRTFNPEAQCFKPIDCITSHFGGISISNSTLANNTFNGETSPPAFKSSTSPVSNSFIPAKNANQMTFTTATFAQTKFGSTKLKSNSKRSHRMSPTEFSNYIKQRALLQQASAQQNVGLPQMPANNALFTASSTSSASPHNSRSLSPNLSQLESANSLMLMATSAASTVTSTSSGSMPFTSQNPFSTNPSTPNSNRSSFTSGLFENGYLNDLVAPGFSKGTFSSQNQQQNLSTSRFASFLDKASPFITSPSTSSNGSTSPSLLANGLNVSFGSLSSSDGSTGAHSPTNSAAKAFDNINYNNLNGVSYSNQYQHLLVAN